MTTPHEALKKAREALADPLNVSIDRREAIAAIDAAMLERQARPTWTDADADAARLALELECLLTDKDVPMPALSRWWDSAHEALELHRKRMAEPPNDEVEPPRAAKGQR